TSRKGAMSQEGDFAPLASALDTLSGNAIRTSYSRKPTTIQLTIFAIHPQPQSQTSIYTTPIHTPEAQNAETQRRN
ncbi:MAG: hypothetical protein J1E98_11235, partial [Lachnospiraceae bacterium]|nr:hypothetical protein [Lachnospiraceae bacterium]